MPGCQGAQAWICRVLGEGTWPTAGRWTRRRKDTPLGWNWAIAHVFHSEGLLLEPLHSQDVLDGDAAKGLITCNREGLEVVLSCTACPAPRRREAPHGPATARPQEREGSWLSFPKGWKKIGRAMDVGLG